MKLKDSGTGGKIITKRNELIEIRNAIKKNGLKMIQIGQGNGHSIKEMINPLTMSGYTAPYLIGGTCKAIEALIIADIDLQIQVFDKELTELGVDMTAEA